MSSRLRCLSFVSTLVVVFVMSLAVPAQAQDARRIEGTWFVHLTLRNCSTGAATGTLFLLNTFLPDGAMLGTPSAPPGAIRTGHGVWTHVGGSRFFNRNGLFVYNPQTGAFLGLRVVSRQIEVGPGGDDFTSQDTDQLYDPATFAPIGPASCATGVGRRVP